MYEQVIKKASECSDKIEALMTWADENVNNEEVLEDLYEFFENLDEDIEAFMKQC